MTEHANDAMGTQSGSGGPAQGSLGSWRVSYWPGSWLVLSGPSSLVMLDTRPGQAGDFVNELWEDVVGAASVSSLVGRLAARGLDGISDLVVLFIENGVMRTLVRGGVRVLDADSGSVLVDGAGVITWRESQISSGRVRVDVGQGCGEDLELPLVVGAARCSGLLVDLNGLPPVAVLEHTESPEPAQERWHPVDGGPGASSAEQHFGSVSGNSPAPFESGSSYEASSGQDETTGAVPMDWMVQRPRDDSFMFEPTEVLGQGQSPSGAPSSPFGSPPEQYTGPQGREGQHTGPERTLGQSAVSPSRGDWSSPSPDRPLAQVVTISGLSQPLNGPLLVGRAPQLPDGMNAEIMRVPSPHHDISRSHLYLEPQDGRVLVTDMNSTNGTIVYMPSANPLRLENGQSILVPVGTTLDLGDGEQINLSTLMG